jgi:hypothetical protein
MEQPLIYVAGPFRAETPWEIEQNIRRAEEYGLFVAKLGGVPVIPHTMYRFFQNSLPDAFWLNAGLTLLQPCVAVAVCVDRDQAQRSFGTVGEIGNAILRNIPIFYNQPRSLLDVWIADWIKEHNR